MHRICLLILISFIALSSEAQIKVRFTEQKKPLYNTIAFTLPVLSGTGTQYLIPNTDYRKPATENSHSFLTYQKEISDSK